jgi:hypothetical protein
MRALAKRPADRFATAAEFARALGVSDLGGKAVDFVREVLGGVELRATRIGVAATAELNDKDDVARRPSARAGRVARRGERRWPETRIAQSPASGSRRRSIALPAAALAIAIAMAMGIIAYTMLDLAPGRTVVTQTEPSAPAPSSGDSAASDGGRRTVPVDVSPSETGASPEGHAGLHSSGTPGTRRSYETEPPAAATEPPAAIRTRRRGDRSSRCGDRTPHRPRCAGETDGSRRRDIGRTVR